MVETEENMTQKTDYYLGFPAVWGGIVITLCCKKYDNEVGQLGTYNPIAPKINKEN